jgi:hypothetical protein
MGDPHCPFDWHVCTPLPEHCLAPDTQTPVHEPLTHVELEQATAVPHAPLALQVWTPLPEHWTAPGVHTPVQAPLTHAWFEHAVPFCQVPEDEQVCGC